MLIVWIETDEKQTWFKKCTELTLKLNRRNSAAGLSKISRFFFFVHIFCLIAYAKVTFTEECGDKCWRRSSTVLDVYLSVHYNILLRWNSIRLYQDLVVGHTVAQNYPITFHDTTCLCPGNSNVPQNVTQWSIEFSGSRCRPDT